jgi:fibronectin-binding autotransporter adhesin
MKPKKSPLNFFALAGSALLATASSSFAQTSYTQASSAGASATDQWSVSGNWSSGVPTGAMNAVIPDKASSFTVAVNSASTPVYSGNLSIGNNVTLRITWTTGIAQNVNALGTPGSTVITMGSNSIINYRNGNTVSPLTIPAITLTGNATFINQESTQGAANPNFDYAITGAHTFTLNGGSGTSSLNANNDFASLVVTNGVTAVGAVAGSFGEGNVTVNGTSKLTFGAGSGGNAMANTGVLSLNGSVAAARLTMNASDTIGGLFLNGVKQFAGAYTSTNAWITGAGTLTVNGAAKAYWNPAGGPAGTWDGSAIWNDQSDLSGINSPWTPGQVAFFNAAGSYGVTVSGTQDIAGIGVDNGNVTISGAGLRLTETAPFVVGSGASASISSTISEDAAGRGLHKDGAGTLTLSGTGNSFTGGTTLGAGTLIAGSANALGTGAVTVAGGTLRLAHANAAATATAIDVNAGALTLQLRGDTATTFAGGPVNFNPTANTQQFTINVDNNGSGTNNQLVLDGGFNRRVNVNQNTAANGMTLNVTGANGYSLSIPTMNLTGGMSTTLNPTTANLSIGTLSATTGTTAFGTANNIVLTLGGGVGTNNSITSITETSGAAQQLIINKNTAAAWTLGNVDTKQGNGHAMSAGTLTLNGTFKFAQASDRKFTVSGGVLNYNNAGAIQTHASTTSGNGLVISGGSLDNTSGAAITTSTTNPRMTWGGDWAFIGTNGANSDLNLGNGAVFLTGTRQVSVTNAATTLTVGGIISGSGFGVTKAGDGTLALGGANSYTGATNVNAGKLLINGSTSTSSAVTVNAGTLGGTGTIGGTVSVVGGAFLAPGASIESLATGALTMASGSTFAYEAASNSATGADLLAVNGAIALTNVTLLFDPVTSAALAGGAWLDGNKLTLLSYIDAGAGITSGFAGYADDTGYTFGSNVWTFNYNDLAAGGNYGTDATASGQNKFVTMTYTVIPEPSAALLASLGALALLRRRR